MLNNRLSVRNENPCDLMLTHSSLGGPGLWCQIFWNKKWSLSPELKSCSHRHNNVNVYLFSTFKVNLRTKKGKTLFFLKNRM